MNSSSASAAEVGADAGIVAANRVRKGGIGGFFSKQAFEVIVEPVEATAQEIQRRQQLRRDATFVPPRRVTGEPGEPGNRSFRRSSTSPTR